MKDLSVKNSFVELRANGWSFDRISKKLNVSKPTLIKWQSELKNEIEETKNTNLEAIKEKYRLTEIEMTRSFGKLVKKVLTELFKRDLSKVSTDKLANLYLRMSDQLNEKVGKEKEIEREDIKRNKKLGGSFTIIERTIH